MYPLKLTKNGIELVLRGFTIVAQDQFPGIECQHFPIVSNINFPSSCQVEANMGRNVNVIRILLDHNQYANQTVCEL